MSRLLGTPIAYVSLIEEEEHFFAGNAIRDADQTLREFVFCAHTIMTSEPLIVEDTENDPRFSQHPIVAGEPGIKSFLGIPLETSPGLRIGALYAFDRKPRTFNENDVQTLTGLTRVAASIINGHRMAVELEEAIALQKGMLPSAARLAQIKAAYPLDLSSYYKPRSGIGGDVWGIEATGPKRITIYVANFAGHGIAAALNAARFHSFFHEWAFCKQRPRRQSVSHADATRYGDAAVQRGRCACVRGAGLALPLLRKPHADY